MCLLPTLVLAHEDIYYKLTAVIVHRAPTAEINKSSPDKLTIPFYSVQVPLFPERQEIYKST